MKKIICTLACFLLVLAVLAQKATVSSGSDGQMLTVVTDSVTEQIEVAPREHVIKDKPQMVSVEDGDSYVVYKGRAYEIADIAEMAFEPRHSRSEDAAVARYRAMTDVMAMGIGFIVPCITIIVALIVFLVFWIKRNNARNAVIYKAIECDYQLPDAFYTGQSASQFDDASRGSLDGGDEQLGAGACTRFTPVPESIRDPKMFSSAMTLIAVGLAVVIFLWVNANAGVAFLCGGIPLFIGIGRMISYYYVPGMRRMRKPQQGYGQPQPRYNDGASFYQKSQQSNYTPRNYDGPCPPPPPASNDETH